MRLYGDCYLILHDGRTTKTVVTFKGLLKPLTPSCMDANELFGSTKVFVLHGIQFDDTVKDKVQHMRLILMSFSYK